MSYFEINQCRLWKAQWRLEVHYSVRWFPELRAQARRPTTSSEQHAQPLAMEKQGSEKVFSGYSEREKLTGRYKVSMETTGRDTS